MKIEEQIAQRDIIHEIVNRLNINQKMGGQSNVIMMINTIVEIRLNLTEKKV